jgi:VCBS repeat-containing protein
VVIDADGNFIYAPEADYNGTDSFTYMLNDGALDSNVATVNITINPVNDAPVAANDLASTAEDTAVTVNVLGNDVDIDSASLSTEVVTGPQHGTVVHNADGSFTYTPDANYNGSDGFTYKLNDGLLDSNVATVEITVNPVNDAPTAGDDTATTDEDVAVTIPVRLNDGDIDSLDLTTLIVSGPSHGTVSVNADGSIVYTADTNYNGSDTLTYKLNDGVLDSNVATVSITVNPVNDAPTAGNDAATTDEDTPVTVLVRTNDGDIDSGLLSTLIVSGAAHGTVSVDADGSILYAPDANYNGSDSLTYRLNDGALDSNVATVNITINPVNDAPVAANDLASTAEDTAVTVNVLGNDVDIDSASLSTEVVTDPQHGMVVHNTDGSFTYTPDANYYGPDGFTYRLSDGALASMATVSITVTPVNDAPTAGNDTATTDEDTPVTVLVRTNDGDIDSAELSTLIVSGPVHGSVSVNADGSVLYTPDANYNGSDTFTYRLNDGSLDSNVATVEITVNPVNDAPTAGNDTATTDEDVAVAVPVRLNDVDIDSLDLATLIVSGPARGTVSVNADGSVVYTANANYNGVDSFTYKLNDGLLDSNIATVSITVNPVNDAPTAGNDSATTDEDTPVTVNVRANDEDIDSADITTLIVSGPTHGTVSVNADGSIVYTADANYNGSDTFTYKLNDGALDSNVAAVQITVNPVNDAPAAGNDSATTDEDVAVSVSVRLNDGDIDSVDLATLIVSGPAHGTVSVSADGGVLYTPDADYNGSDSFTYKLNDGFLDSNVATVAITVNPINDRPVAGNDSASTAEDTAVTVNVLGNDVDIDSASLATEVVTGPQHGTVAHNVDGSFTYTPDADYNGSDSFTYRLSDGELDAIASVSIAITPVNDAPTAGNDTGTTDEDTTVTVNVRANDGDIDSAELTTLIVSGPAHGTVSVNADGSVVYTPDADYNGSDSFTYKVNDGFLDSNVATVDITIAPVNDAPTAGSDSAATDEDTPVTVLVRANDGDIDSAELSTIIVVGPAHGTVAVGADGDIVYTPEANYNGGDTFTYRLNDGALDSNIATVAITVNAVNDAPVAADASVTTAEDTALQVDPRLYGDDIEESALSTLIVAGPQHGTLSANGDGTFAYAPDANYNGSDSFTYKVSDGELESNVATVTVSITAVNDAPVALSESATTAEDAAVTVAVRANDEDIDSATLSTVLVAGPLNGSVALNADGSFTYTPNANHYGQDSFTYKVSDGELDSNVATVSITVTPVNDAPVAADATLTTAEDVPLQVDPRGYATDIDSETFTTQIVSGPQHGSLVQQPDGSFVYMAEADYNGPDGFTYRVSDGALDSNLASVSIVVTPVNDAPVAISSSVSGSEDEPYIFTWADFSVSDRDNADWSIVIASLPLDGMLQYYDGTAWTVVTVGQVVTRADIDAGCLCFGPDANESGFDGYATDGTGNLKRTYASFTYQAFDGALLSNQATIDIDLAPVADTPALVLMDPPDESGASRERFNTSWETAPNRNHNFTIVPHSTLEGWLSLTEDGYTCDSGFVVWSNNDRMKDANNVKRTVYAAADDGRNWLELGDSGVNHQGYAIERFVRTRVQATYTLSLDYAGRLGYAADQTRIGVYLDGVQVGTYANTSPNTSLNWQAISFQFTGDGTLQRLRITIEDAPGCERLGAMIDDIRLVEELPLNTGYSNNPIQLSAIVSTLADEDGSESLAITVSAIPVGATLTDGTNSFTAATGSTAANVTAWNLDSLSITAPPNFVGTFTLTVGAQATESVTGETATKSLPLLVTVLQSQISSPLVVDLGSDGVQTVSLESSTGTFDLLNTGAAVRSGWISPEDAFLALDANGNGVIDDRSELFGGAVGEGFAKLASFDSNFDGMVDAADPRFRDLLLWRDLNGNHRTDAGELGSVAAHGLASLSTRYVIAPEEQNGNWLLERGTATFADGRKVDLVDAYFRVEAAAAQASTLDRAATITVQSVLPSAQPVFVAGAAFSRPIGPLGPMLEPAPVIDWSATQGDSEENAKKKRSVKGWLADFLGLGGKQSDLAARTGLKVILDSRNQRR